MTTPAYLPADWRYAGDDWTGANALTYLVYTAAPVYAADGVTITTPGVPMDLTGCSITGSLCFTQRASRVPVVNMPFITPPVGMILGDPKTGTVALSLARGLTAFPRQDFTAWGDPSQALLIAQPTLVNPSGEAVTIGLQPLFVF